MPGELFFGGTEAIEPTGRDDIILNGQVGQAPTFDESDADEDIPYENPHTGEYATLKRAASPNDSGRPIKTIRVIGGKAAVPKRIVADYDSDDGRIITLKQQGYSDEYVSQKLINENRIRYVPKTVGSRWLRLRKALEAAENERLDEELSDWHIGEDAELQESVKAINEKFEHEMEKVMENKWKEIAQNLADRLHKKKYTGKACCERLNGLQDGSALLPIEIDPDKDTRKRLRDQRIAANKQRRIDAAAEGQRAEDEKKARLEDKKAEAQDNEQQKILKTREREAVKAKSESLRLEKEREKKRAREAKRVADEKDRAQKKWQKDQRKAEKELYIKFTGKAMRGGRITGGGGGRRTSRQDDEDDDADEEDAMELSDEEEAVETGNEDSDDDDDMNVDDGMDLGGDGSDLNGGSTSESTKSTPPKKRKPATKPKVTKETLLNPRSIMTEGELEWLLHERQLPRRGSRENHPMIVARLCATDEDLSTSDLNDLLQRYFDNKKGSKAAKILRLAEYDAARSAAGEKGVKASDTEFKKSYEGYKGE